MSILEILKEIAQAQGIKDPGDLDTISIDDVELNGDGTVKHADAWVKRLRENKPHWFHERTNAEKVQDLLNQNPTAKHEPIDASQLSEQEYREAKRQAVLRLSGGGDDAFRLRSTQLKVADIDVNQLTAREREAVSRWVVSGAQSPEFRALMNGHRQLHELIEGHATVDDWQTAKADTYKRLQEKDRIAGIELQKSDIDRRAMKVVR
jgi:ribosome-binding factor A